jgi:hypothetical protein
MFHITSIGPEAKFIQVKLIMVFATVVMNTSNPTLQVNDLLMKAFKGTPVATPPLFSFREIFFELVVGWEPIGNDFSIFFHCLFDDGIDHVVFVANY